MPMDDLDFDDTLTLSKPLALAPGRAGGPRAHLYFSTLVRDGRDTVVCVSVVVPAESKLTLLAQGTRAHVIGRSRTVRTTLIVAAKCILPLTGGSNGIGASVEECQSSLLWAALILGGVVSTPDLVTSQPALLLSSISIERQLEGDPAKVFVTCNVDATSVQCALLDASVVSYTDDSLTVAVHSLNASVVGNAAGLLSMVMFFLHWLGTVLHILHEPVPDASTTLQLRPTLASLALDDDGFPVAELPGVIISARRAVQPPSFVAPTVRRRIYSGVSRAHIRDYHSLPRVPGEEDGDVPT